MVSIRNPVAHGAAPDGLTIAALGLMDNLGLCGIFDNHTSEFQSLAKQKMDLLYEV